MTNADKQTIAEREQMGFIVLCFDDGYIETYKVAYPILRRRGFTAVVAVITSYVGGVWRDWEVGKEPHDYELTTLSQLKEMRADGWEIAPHSLTHSPHEWILNYQGSQEYFEMILKDSQDWIRRNKLGEAQIFIYPFGATPQAAVDNAKKYYWLCRSLDIDSPVYYNLPMNEDQRHRLWAYQVEHARFEEQLKEIREWIRYAKKNEAIITFTFHRITEKPRDIDSTADELEEILDLILKENAVAMTYEDIIARVWGRHDRSPV